ncbi:MAG: SAM-dependent methyltransferase [Paraglaciecola sp.]|jgi:SAM-dependent methyltransferase
MNEFGLIDYIKMARARGVRLPISYFCQNHLFDLVRRVDTHIWEPDSNLSLTEGNKDNGVFYMASWRNVVVESTKHVINDMDEPLSNFAFLDVGCGKGKVILVWAELLPDNVKIVGVDYNENLLSVCRENLTKRAKLERVNLIQSDVTKVNLGFLDSIVVYLYNPFSAHILNRFMQNLKGKKVYVIYNNPIHSEVFHNWHFTCIYQKKSWHPNACFNIYKS